MRPAKAFCSSIGSMGQHMGCQIVNFAKCWNSKTFRPVWRREWDSNRRYGVGTCRGDSVAIRQTKSRSKERLSGFLLRIQHLIWLRG